MWTQIPFPAAKFRFQIFDFLIGAGRFLLSRAR